MKKNLCATIFLLSFLMVDFVSASSSSGENGSTSQGRSSLSSASSRQGSNAAPQKRDEFFWRYLCPNIPYAAFYLLTLHFGSLAEKSEERRTSYALSGILFGSLISYNLFMSKLNWAHYDKKLAEQKRLNGEYRRLNAKYKDANSGLITIVKAQYDQNQQLSDFMKSSEGIEAVLSSPDVLKAIEESEPVRKMKEERNSVIRANVKLVQQNGFLSAYVGTQNYLYANPIRIHEENQRLEHEKSLLTIENQSLRAQLRAIQRGYEEF